MASKKNNNVDILDIKEKIEKLSLSDNTNSIKITNIELKLGSLETLIRQEYTTLDKFEPVKLIAYGLAGGALLTILGAILALVIAPEFSHVVIPPV